MPQTIASAESNGTAAHFVPDTGGLDALRRAASGCTACPLYRTGTQTVFGEGPPDATAMLVGEQPGDQEDLSGRPFVGPAGQLLNDALEQAGIDRERCYVTNAVKHFKWVAKGKRRIHAKPNAREIRACQPWLEAEIATLRPRAVICLGATAAQSLLGPAFRVTKERGMFVQSALAPYVLATVHPSSILRARDPGARAEEMDRFVADLRKAASVLNEGLAAR